MQLDQVRNKLPRKIINFTKNAEDCGLPPTPPPPPPPPPPDTCRIGPRICISVKRMYCSSKSKPVAAHDANLDIRSCAVRKIKFW